MFEHKDARPLAFKRLLRDSANVNCNETNVCVCVCSCIKTNSNQIRNENNVITVKLKRAGSYMNSTALFPCTMFSQTILMQNWFILVATHSSINRGSLIRFIEFIKQS